ncbi:MAG: hypothetical protein A2Z18_05380 [Armatimonadetes bacterium RBG_16_58_9]|nr:MAG: hypothetical protein A2Z18_05380 [Armatimonadetes bacterium RBG_16_58_9]
MEDGRVRKGIGIVGYGGFGEFIRRAWDAMDNAGVVAVCDSDASRDPKDVAFYTDADGIMADGAVDILSIATPPNSHTQFAIQAMRAGKHVLIEKPLALSESEGELVKKAAEETGRVATVNFVLRFNPIVEALGEIVRAEALGKLRRVDLRNYAMQETVPEGHWFWDPNVSGRILLEHGVHFFDLASSVIESRASEMWSLGVDRKPGMEDRVFAAVKYENGVVGTFWHSFSRPRPLETTTFHFAFDLGEIDMFGWIPLELDMWGWTDRRGLDKLKAIREDIELSVNHMKPTKAHSSEHYYDVEFDINAVVKLESPKLDVYSDNLRAIMNDVIKAIDDPNHQMRVTIDDALEAVRTAERATRFAHTD